MLQNAHFRAFKAKINMSTKHSEYTVSIQHPFIICCVYFSFINSIIYSLYSTCQEPHGHKERSFSCGRKTPENYSIENPHNQIQTIH